MDKKRSVGLDIIKSLAAIFVISIHQLGQTHVLAMNMVGVRAFFIMMFRYTVMSCVPMFIMATGYLQCRKTADKRFYGGIFPVLFTYLFTTGIIVLIQYLLGDNLTAGGVVLNTLRFTQNGYAWYVEMFIGLYLLIPFINMSLGQTRRQRHILLGVLFGLTILPSAFIAFSIDLVWLDIAPDYWTAFYPVLYYALGAYIREYQPKINKAINVLLIIASAVLPSAVLFLKAHGGEFEPFGYVFNGFNSLSAFLLAFFIFMLFYRIDIKFTPVRAILMSISRLTLEIYLLSFIVERGAYSVFNSRFGTDFAFRLPVMIAVVFGGSYAFALCYDGVRRLVRMGKNALISKAE